LSMARALLSRARVNKGVDARLEEPTHGISVTGHPTPRKRRTGDRLLIRPIGEQAGAGIRDDMSKPRHTEAAESALSQSRTPTPDPAINPHQNRCTYRLTDQLGAPGAAVSLIIAAFRRRFCPGGRGFAQHSGGRPSGIWAGRGRSAP